MPRVVHHPPRDLGHHRHTNIDRRLTPSTWLTHDDKAWVYAVFDTDRIFWSTPQQRTRCDDQIRRVLATIALSGTPVDGREMHLLALAADDPDPLPGQETAPAQEPHPRPALLAVGARLHSGHVPDGHTARCRGRRRRRCRCWARDAQAMEVAFVAADGRCPSDDEADRLLSWYCRGSDPAQALVTRDDGRALGCVPWAWDPMHGPPPDKHRFFYWHTDGASGLQLSGWPAIAAAGGEAFTADTGSVVALLADQPQLVAVSIRAHVAGVGHYDPPLRLLSGVAAQRVDAHSDAGTSGEIFAYRQIDALRETRPGDRTRPIATAGA